MICSEKARKSGKQMYTGGNRRTKLSSLSVLDWIGRHVEQNKIISENILTREKRNDTIKETEVKRNERKAKKN